MTVSHMLPLTVPMDVPVDGLEPESHVSGFLEPLIGFGVFIVIVALLVAAFFLLRRKGLVPPLPRWFDRAAAPEQTARQVLAERFARGDISSDDFLERASVLNWTPGSDDHLRRRVGRS